MKPLIIILSSITLLIHLAMFTVNAQSEDDYRTVANGTWNTLARWQRFDGTSWMAAVTIPTDTDGVITIRSPHTITASTVLTIDQVTIDAGGTLIVQNLFTIADGPGTDLNCNGTLNGPNSIEGSGSISVNSGGTFYWTNGGFSGSGSITIQSGAFAYVQGAPTKRLGQTWNFINNALMIWTASIVFLDVAQLNNNGTIDLQGDYNFTNGYAGGNPTVNNTGIIKKTAGAGNSLISIAFNNSGTVNVNSGTLKIEINGTHSGIYNISQGCTLTGPIAMSYSGADFTNNGNVKLKNLTFAGLSPQQLNGTGNIDTLALGGTGGVTLGGTQTINNSLTFSNGNIMLGNYELLMGPSAMLNGGNASSYAVTEGTGSLRRTVHNNETDVLFPVGLNNSYLPVRIQLTSASALDNFSVRVLDNLYGSYDASDNQAGLPILSNIVNRSWIINEGSDGGSSATITVQWNASDESAVFDRATSHLGHYINGGFEVSPASSAIGAGPYSLSQSGFSIFSPFGVIGQFATTDESFSFCSGQPFNIPYTVTGTFNQGNIFTAQLSDSAGSFANPVILGTDASTASGIFSGTIPNNTPAGDFLLRIVSTDPLFTGNENFVSISTGYNIAESVSICAGDTYIFPDGNSSDVPVVHESNFSSAAGCDSIITTTLSVTSYYTTEDNSICQGETYIFPDGDTSSVPIGHISNLTSMEGCDSIVITNLSVNVVDVSATISLPTITANANNAFYQWLDCNNGFSEINGETNQSFTASAPGNYAVLVSENGCTDTSACYTIIPVGMEKHDAVDVAIYPNPAADIINIRQSSDYKEMSITLTNMLGQKLPATKWESILNNGKPTIEIDLSALREGIYFIRVDADDKTGIFKIIKD